VRKLVYGAVALLTGFGIVIGGATTASAVVLVNQPPSRVCVGHTFRVGVWYQQFSGGSRRYRVTVYNPQRQVILHKTGQAPSSHWRFWRVTAAQTGDYHTTYRTIVHGQWRPYRVTTVSHHC
jgi:hypothetical protein